MLQRSAGDADIKETQSDISQLKNKVESLQGESWDESHGRPRGLAVTAAVKRMHIAHTLHLVFSSHSRKFVGYGYTTLLLCLLSVLLWYIIILL